MWFLQSTSETNVDVMFLIETSLNETFFPVRRRRRRRRRRWCQDGGSVLSIQGPFIKRLMMLGCVSTVRLGLFCDQDNDFLSLSLSLSLFSNQKLQMECCQRCGWNTRIKKKKTNNKTAHSLAGSKWVFLFSVVVFLFSASPCLYMWVHSAADTDVKSCNGEPTAQTSFHPSPLFFSSLLSCTVVERMCCTYRCEASDPCMSLSWL